MSNRAWNAATQATFEEILKHLPQFHRSIAQKLVKESAQNLAHVRGSNEVQDCDLFQAFFNEVPPAFKEMMVRLFGHLNIEYQQFISDEDAQAASQS